MPEFCHFQHNKIKSSYWAPTCRTKDRPHHQLRAFLGGSWPFCVSQSQTKAKPERAASLFSPVALKHPKSNCDSLVNPWSTTVSYRRHNLRECSVCVWDSIFNYPGNTARCSITLAMALIKSSKIFISIRRPHATCIINVQPKDTTTTFTAHISVSGSPAHAAAHRYCTCVQMEMDEQHSTGRSKVSQTAFWDVTVPPTQQMCRAALWMLSLGVFLLGKHHPKHPSLSRLWGWMCYLLSLTLPIDTSRQLANAPSLLWAEEHPTRTRDEVQGEFAHPQLCGMAFTSDLSEETSHFISDLNHLNGNHNSSTLSSQFPLFLSFHCIWLLVSSDPIIILSRFSGGAWPLLQRL